MSDLQQRIFGSGLRICSRASTVSVSHENSCERLIASKSPRKASFETLFCNTWKLSKWKTT